MPVIEYNNGDTVTVAESSSVHGVVARLENAEGEFAKFKDTDDDALSVRASEVRSVGA